ncbi:Translin family protein [Trifolium repens]|nr:Translin family protein [Trifolium repens]
MKYDLRKVEEVYYDVKIRGLKPNGESVADQGIERLKINATQKNDKKKMKRSEWNGEKGKKRRKIVVPSFFAHNCHHISKVQEIIAKQRQ